MAHETVRSSSGPIDPQLVNLANLDDEQLGQLALKHTRPADRDPRVWEALCTGNCRPRVIAALLTMKARNAAAINARQFPSDSARACAGDRRAFVQAQRQWHSRATKFGRRVDEALTALAAEPS